MKIIENPLIKRAYLVFDIFLHAFLVDLESFDIWMLFTKLPEQRVKLEDVLLQRVVLHGEWFLEKKNQSNTKGSRTERRNESAKNEIWEGQN